MNRRRWMLGATAVAGGWVTGRVEAADARIAGTPGSDESPVRLFALLRGSLDHSLVIGAATGLFSGMVGHESTPLYGFVAVTFSVYRERPDGSFVVGSLEQTYYTDPSGERVIEDWANPYTRRRVAVPVFRGPATRSVIKPDLQFEIDAPSTVTMRQYAEPVATVPRGHAFRETIDVRIAAKSDAPARFYRESDVYRVGVMPAGERLQRIEADVNFTSLLSWRPWLQMDDVDGYLVGSGGGRKGIAMEQLPPQWLDATQKSRPELLDPLPLLTAVLDG